jgi:DNA gyrase subunit A
MLREFIDFRQETVRRRFEFELEELRRRIHILEGFAIVFDALDEAVRIIRKSDGKADAAVKLSKRFELSDAQTDAILELKLYKLARLEIDAILAELRERKARAKEIQAILDDKRKLMRVVRGEIVEVAERFPDKRRTKVGGGGGDDVEFVAEDFIVDEEVTVILSRDGWLKRVREVKDLSATRLREGDAILAAMRGSTKEAVAAILDGLKWLELDWDGDVIYQFSRAARHREVAEQLLASGKAYRCYATAEELTAMREKARAEGRTA